MSKVINLTLVGILVVLNAFSQDNKLEDARNAFFASDLVKAKTIIDQVVKDPAQSGSYHSWFWRGAIYKEIYKTTEKGKVYDSQNRVESIKSYKQALADKSTVSEDSINSILKSLKYLSSTLYNDAVVQLDTVGYMQAEKNYNWYVDLTKFLNPSADLTPQNIKFKMKLATIYVSLYEANSKIEKGNEYFESAKKEYNSIIEMNKTHLSANYNLGILFYNRAVHIIQSMEYDIDLEALSKKEEVCVELFLQALPYVKTAYDLNPQRKETLISLKGIYYSLNDQEKYDKYEKELDALSN